MPTPSELVTDSFAQARSYIVEHKAQLLAFTNTLNELVQNAPLASVTFTPIADPGIYTVAPYEEPEEYTSTTLTALQTAVNERMAGGTGIPAAVETDIWDRARERELDAAQASIDTITRDSQSLGWALPAGVTFDAIRRETRAFYDKSATFSRDVAIKQAELEQANLQKIFEQAVSLESLLATIRTQRSQQAVDKLRANVEKFRAEVEQDVKHWETQIKQYEATITYTLGAERVNSELLRANAALNLEAAKAGTQAFAQLLASAYGMIHTSAGVSASASNGVSYSYSNDTATAPPSITAV